MDINKLYNAELQSITIVLDDGTVVEDDKEVIKRYAVCANVLSGIDTDLLLLLDGVTTPRERRKKLEEVITELCRTHGKRLDR